MAQSHTFTDVYRARVAELLMPDITHCAVGDGAVSGLPSPAALGLTHEIGRVHFVERYFVTPDAAGPLVFDGVKYSPSPVPTRFIYLGFRFEDDEAVGNWSELGVYGAGVTYVQQQSTLVEDGVAGDDKIDRDIILSGAWAPAVAGEVGVTIVAGGGSGVATLSWSDPGNIGIGGGGPLPVTFNSPVSLGASGTAISFSGGVDGVLTAGDRWRVLGTLGPSRPEYASGGVYNPNSNVAGQVLNPGLLLRLSYMDPPQEKTTVFLDIQMVLEVIRP
jgi:hypothetical protein